MIWRGVLGFVGFWFSFYALSFTPISMDLADGMHAAWWAIPYALTFGSTAVGSLVLVVNAFYASLDDDKRLLAWLLSRVT